MPQEFNLAPILLDDRIINGQKTIIDEVNYQVLPKMKVLHSVYVQVRKVNAKTENWNNYLEMYQSNNRNISNFLIKAMGN
ncbi:MAG: hypothetical protein WBB24_08225 [Maribacter sp.]